MVQPKKGGFPSSPSRSNFSLSSIRKKLKTKGSSSYLKRNKKLFSVYMSLDHPDSVAWQGGLEENVEELFIVRSASCGQDNQDFDNDSESVHSKEDTFLPKHLRRGNDDVGKTDVSKTSSFVSLIDDRKLRIDEDEEWSSASEDDYDIDEFDRFDGAILRSAWSSSYHSSDEGDSKRFKKKVRKLLPPPQKYSNGRRKKLVAMQQQRQRRESPLFYKLNSQLSDTTDTEEESSFSVVSTSDDDCTNPASSSITRISSIKSSLLLSRPKRCVQWPDEWDQPLETVHVLPKQTESTCRIILLLMNAPISNYEFLHAEFQTAERLKVIDVLKQIPKLRRENNTENNRYFVDLEYSSLCVLGKELINMLAIQDYFCAGSDDSENLLRDGLIFLAIPSKIEKDCKEVIQEGEALLENKVLRREIRRVRIAGRGLQPLLSSAAFQKQEADAKEAKRRRRKLKKEKAALATTQPEKEPMPCTTPHEEKLVVNDETSARDSSDTVSLGSIGDDDFDLQGYNFVETEELEHNFPRALSADRYSSSVGTVKS